MKDRPRIVCICGSSRFKDEHLAYTMKETLKGHIILGAGFFHHVDKVPITSNHKDKLDSLHLHKIELADEIFVINPNGYIGESTRENIAYAIARGKDIRFLDEQAGEEYLEANNHELGALVARKYAS